MNKGLIVALLLSLPGTIQAAELREEKKAEPQPKAIEHEVRDVEGWKVHIDGRLLAGADAELGSKALRVLAFKLSEIKTLLPRSRVEKLQKVRIFLDLAHPRLKSMQYHPSADWLKDNGHDPVMAKAVHLPQAAELTGRFLINQQPMAILHELSHAYHDQVLGFDEPRIKAAWARFKDSGKYEKVLHISGKEIRHYGLTNQMEFFAEMTESFFGTNDFYPFVRGELKKELPDVDKLLEEIWLKEEESPAPRGALPPLQERLTREDAAALAAAARRSGDANRGALVFYRPELACTRCHTAGEDGIRLGPDLAKAGKEATDVSLIESVLLPSKIIKKGYETLAVTTKAGFAQSGPTGLAK